MSARARNGIRRARTARVVAAAVAVASLLAARGAQASARPAREPGTSLVLGIASGTTFVDPHFGDYAWDTRPHTAWGASAALARGRFALGARAWRSSTTQRLALPGGALAPRVRTTTLEAVASARVASLAGLGLALDACAGRRRLDWTPDHANVDAGGTPIDVTFAPLSSWVAGAGATLRAPLPARCSAALSIERAFFALDTAHRAGTTTVLARETFGDWSARLELARHFSLGTKGATR